MLRTYGIGESHVADLFEQAGGDPDGVETSICARNYEVEIDIRSTAEGEAAGLQLWQRLQADLEPHLFATDDRPIAEIVLELARPRGLTLVTAESCTGGMVAAELTAIPGSSDVFAGGAVTYSDRLKHELLGVPEATLEQHGAVSAETARAMAEGARRAAGRRPGGGGDRRGRPRRRHRGEAGGAGVPARERPRRRGRAADAVGRDAARRAAAGDRGGAAPAS